MFLVHYLIKIGLVISNVNLLHHFMSVIRFFNEIKSFKRSHVN